MAKHVDFFELKTAADLFRKLEGDLAVMKSSQDTKAAFNFFVTAEHLPDWLGLRDLVKKHAILKVVSHIANGAKHFTLDPRRHTSVVSTEKSRYIEEGYFESGYFDEPLLIHLSPDEARDIGVSPIDAAELGLRVLDFWRPHVPNP